jgi:hypothetical protein
LSQKSDSSGVVISLDKARVRFDARYASIKPIRFLHKTYLVIYGTTEVTRDYAAIIKPFGADQYSSICLFKK